MITHTRQGGRKIELFTPFRHKGKLVRAITLDPLTFGHYLDWQNRRWANSVELLVNLVGGDEELVRSIRYPDADRVLQAFLEMLTPEIKRGILEQQQPVEAPTPEPETQPQEQFHQGPQSEEEAELPPELQPLPPEEPEPPSQPVPAQPPPDPLEQAKKSEHWPYPDPARVPQPEGFGFDLESR